MNSMDEFLEYMQQIDPLWSVVLVGVALAVLVVAKLWSATFLRILAGTLTVAVLVAIGAGGYYGYSYFENLRRLEERQALDERAEALFSKTVEPDSVFACVDGSPAPAMQEACERSLFAEPARVAAAVSIVTQRLAFLYDALAFVAARDPEYAKRIESMRNSIEADPYGFVAFVLSVEHRCSLESCARFAMLRDPAQVKENMRVRRFEAHMAKYAATWRGAHAPEEPTAKAGASTSPLVTISAGPKPEPAESKPPEDGDAKKSDVATEEPAPVTELPAAALAPIITPPADASFATQPAESKQEAKAAAPAKGAASAAKSANAPAAKSATAPEKSAARPPAPAKSKAKDPAAQRSSAPVAGLPRVVPSEYIREQEEKPAAPEQSSVPQPGAPTPITPLQQNFDSR
jgi:hypothetical protein